MQDANSKIVEFNLSGQPYPKGGKWSDEFGVEVNLKIEAEVIFPGDDLPHSVKPLKCSGYIQPLFNGAPVGAATVVEFRTGGRSPSLENGIAYNLPYSPGLLEWIYQEAVNAFWRGQEKSQKKVHLIVTAVEAVEAAA